MTGRKLLLASLFALSFSGYMAAQSHVHVSGTVTSSENLPQENVTILVTALFPASTSIFETLVTDSLGRYEVDFQTPGGNVVGTLDVSMVDCWGVIVSQAFFIDLGDQEFQADFTYCEAVLTDSCAVIILEESSPNGFLHLTAWTPPGLAVNYHWSTGEITQSIVPGESGAYCVTVSFSSGCVETDCIIVNLDTTATCFAYIIAISNNDGTYQLNAIPDGHAPFTWLWNTGDTTSHIDHAPPGEYCVTLTDATGCTFTTCTFIDVVNFCEVYITEDSAGVLTAHGFGLAPLQYAWSTGESAGTITAPEPGLYCVTITDANDCVAASCYHYGLFEDSCYVYVHAFVTDTNTLALQAVAFSQADIVSFAWSTGDTTETIYPQNSIQSYCVTVTDAEDCVASACFESAFWCYTWIGLEYVDTVTAILTAHSDPIFNLPGTPAPQFLWSNGDTTQAITVHHSGYYCVTVTMGNACETHACMPVDFESLDSSCWVWVLPYTDPNGHAGAEAWTWGWGDFSYLWSNGDTASVTVVSHPNENLCVTVTSSFGCQATACLETSPGPCEPVVLLHYTSNTSATLTAVVSNAGNPAVHYLWSTGESGASITVTETGTYCVTVETGGCTGTACINVHFVNIDTCGVWISANSHNIPGVEYTANAWGTPPFTYLWSNGWTEPSQIIDFGIHDVCVTVTDANGCVSSGCNYVVGDCGVELYYSPDPLPSVHIDSPDPVAQVYWTNTGDTLPWLVITEPGEYCALVTTIFGCVSYACIDVDSVGNNGGFNVITGYVFAGPLQDIQGTVYAYAVSNNTGQAFTLVDSALIGTDQLYFMSGLPDGLYLLKAELTPGTPGADAYLPTYHRSAVAWVDADLHHLPNFLTVTTDIHLAPSADLQGGGVIGGVITDPDDILAGDDPVIRGLTGLAGIVVLLKDENGNPLQFTRSLENGSFRFTELPYGTYRVSFDVPGIPSPEIWVTLTPDNSEQVQITLIVNRGSVGTEAPGVQQVHIYPNPASHEIYIPLGAISGTYTIRLTDMQGKVVYAGSVRDSGGVLTLRVDTFAPGIYSVQLNDGPALYHGRFIKQQ